MFKLFSRVPERSDMPSVPLLRTEKTLWKQKNEKNMKNNLLKPEIHDIFVEFLIFRR